MFVAQILGGITSAAIVSALFPGDLRVRTTLSGKHSFVCARGKIDSHVISGNTSIVQGLFIEMFLTAELVFTIFMLAAEVFSRIITKFRIYANQIITENKSDFPCTDRYRFIFVRSRTRRSILHWWIFEPSTILRAMRSLKNV